MTLTFVTSKGRRFKEIFGILNLDGFKFSAFLNVFLIQFNTIRSWMVSFNNKLKDPSLIHPFTPPPPPWTQTLKQYFLSDSFGLNLNMQVFESLY